MQQSAPDNDVSAELKPVPGARRLEPGLAGIIMMTALTAIGQFALYIYTPSLPSIAEYLRVETGAAQMTFTVFLLIFAASLLVFGPLTDRFGRKPVLLTGFILFLAGTLMCVLASSFDVLMVGRMVQASGAASALIVSRSVIRDSFSGVELQRMIATVAIAFSLIPGLTPLIGGLVQEYSGWRANFWLTLLIGTGLAAWTTIRLPETAQTLRRSIDVTTIFRGYYAVLSDRVAVTYCLATGMIFGSVSAFFVGSPALYIEHLDVEPAEYGFYPMFAIVGFVLGGVVTRKYSGQATPYFLVGSGLGIMLVATAFMLIMPVTGIAHKHFFNGAMIFQAAGLGIFHPAAVSEVLARFPSRVGTASATQSFIQMTGGAFGAFAVSLIQPEMPVIALPLVMFAMVVAATGTFSIGLCFSAKSRTSPGSPE